MSALKQIQDNVSTFEDPDGLSDTDAETLMRTAEAFKKQVSIPCTACRYCCDGRPMEINIPAFLSVYNSCKTDGPWALNQMGGLDSVGKPADCINCGACTEYCPQSINIPKSWRSWQSCPAKIRRGKESFYAATQKLPALCPAAALRRL